MTEATLYSAVINLKRAKDRREIQTQQFARLGLNVDFFPACDMLDPAVQAQAATMPDHGPWTIFYIQDKACTLSHLAVLRAFLEGEATHCLVLEDDVLASHDIADWMGDLSWWPDDAEIVKIEAWQRKTGPVLLGDPATHLGRQVSRLFSKHQGGAGYLVSRAGAEKILGDPRVIDVPIDHLLFNPEGAALARELVVYQVWPALIQQGNAPETEGSAPPRTAQGQNKIKRELKRLALRLRRVPVEWTLRLNGRATPRLIAWQDQMNPAKAG